MRITACQHQPAMSKRLLTVHIPFPLSLAPSGTAPCKFTPKTSFPLDNPPKAGNLEPKSHGQAQKSLQKQNATYRVIQARE
jgi:hypothetical protein